MGANSKEVALSVVWAAPSPGYTLDTSRRQPCRLDTTHIAVNRVRAASNSAGPALVERVTLSIVVLNGFMMNGSLCKSSIRADNGSDTYITKVCANEPNRTTATDPDMGRGLVLSQN